MYMIRRKLEKVKDFLTLPKWYQEEMNPPEQKGIGIKTAIKYLKKIFPEPRHVYFNPNFKNR